MEDGFGSFINLYYYISIETHFTAFAEERTVYVPLNGSATLKVIANSDVPDKITYEWYSYDIDGISGNDATLTLNAPEHGGWYYCTVRDGFGSTTTVSFEVRLDTGFDAYAKENPVYVAPGAKATLEIVATSDYPEKLSFTWYQYEKEVYSPLDWYWSNVTLLEGETGPTLTTEAIDEWSRYHCVVSDG